MKKYQRIIIAIISIVVTVVLAIFLFNQEPEFIRVGTTNNEQVVLTPVQNFFKNMLISVFCGSSIYLIFYGIPHEYKIANKKKKDEE